MTQIHKDLKFIVRCNIVLIILIACVGVVSATSTYDISTNLITVQNGTNTLSSIYTDVNNASVFSVSDGVYVLDTNIVILSGATVNITDTSLSFNSSYRLWTKGYLYVENSTITSANKTDISKRGYIMGRNFIPDTGWILQIRNSTLSYLGPGSLDEYGEYCSGIFAYPPQTGYGVTSAPVVIDNNNLSHLNMVIGEHTYPDYIRNNVIHDIDGEYNTAIMIQTATFDNNTVYNMPNNYGIFTLGSAKITNNTIYNVYAPDSAGIIRAKEGPGGYLIANNIIHDGNGNGAIMDAASQRTAWSAIRDNTIYNFTGSAILVSGNGYDDGTGPNTLVLNSYVNNTIYNVSGGYGAIYLSHAAYFGLNIGAKNILFEDNTVRDSDVGVFVEGDDYTNITFRNNDFYNNNVDIRYSDGSSSREIAGNNTAKFINTNYNVLNIGGGMFNSYHNLDVYVEDINGNPVSNAIVNITNDINNVYPSININGENQTSFTTLTDGHIPLPIGNESNSAAVLDFVKTSTQEIQMSYTIEASYQGYTSIITGVNLESSWYRTNPNAYDNTIVITLPFTQGGVNNAPVLASIGVKSVDEGSSLTFITSASDADSDSLTYSATNLPTGASLDATTGSFTWTPSDGQVGTYVVTFMVSDGSLTDSETVTITVNEVIGQLALTAIDNRLRESTPDSVLGDATWLDVGRIDSTGNYRDVILFDLSQFNSTDHVEQATLSLFWYYENRNQSTDVGIYRPGNWDGDYVTWNTPTNGVVWNNPGGDWYDMNNVAQGAEPYAAVTFPVETSPDYMYHDFDVTEMVQSYIDGTYDNTGFFIKANEIDNSYIAFYSSDWSNASQRPKLSITSTPEDGPVDNGLNLISITPTTQTTPGETFTLTIPITPGAPIAGAQFDLLYDGSMATVTSVTEGNLLNQDGATTLFNSGTIDNTAGTVTNVYGSILGETSVSSQGSFATISMTAGSTTGYLNLDLTNVKISDADSNAAPYTLTNATILIDTAPVLTQIGAKSVDESSALAFTTSASDADGDSLTYSATGLPAGASFNTATGEFSWTPADGEAGNYVVTFEVTDGYISDLEDVTITVNDANNAPVITTFVPENSLTYNESDVITIGIIANDADGQALSYTIKIDGVTQSTSSSYVWETDYSSAGTHTIDIIVSDGIEQVTDQRTITINDVHPRWDVNEDGTVDVLDISIIGQEYGTSVEAPYPRWDVNQDDAINVQDMALTGSHFGETVA